MHRAANLLAASSSPEPCRLLSRSGELTHASRPLRAANALPSTMTVVQDNKPTGAADRCLDCPVESDCAFSAKKIYLRRAERGHFSWPVAVLLDGRTCLTTAHARLGSSLRFSTTRFVLLAKARSIFRPIYACIILEHSMQPLPCRRWNKH